MTLQHPAQRMGWLVACATLVADQIFKNVLLYGLDFRNLGPAARIDILPFLDFVMVWNRGVSYGLFQADGPVGTYILATFSLAAVAGLAWWLGRAANRVLGIGLGFVIGGALGNAADRLIYGAVADFFHFHAFGRDWYVFNLADAAITVGVVLLLADGFIRSEAKTDGEREGEASNREPVIRK